MDSKTLQPFADNDTLSAAVRKLLEDQFSTDSLKADHSDEVLGQMVRARIVGLKAIEEAFKEIAKCKTVKDSGVDKLNPGR